MRITIKQMHEFAYDLEGRVPFMYLDDARPIGLVTVGLGNLIDPLYVALALPWNRQDGTPAPREDVVRVWTRVKGMQAMRSAGLKFRSDPSLVLSDDMIDLLVQRRLESNHAIMRKRWPEIDTWPLDAELFAHSWAWAVGANSPYPRMTEHLRNRRFAAAATEATINPQIGTIVKRNARNQVLLQNADRVERHGLDRDVLYWPRPLAAEYSGDDPPTAA